MNQIKLSDIIIPEERQRSEIPAKHIEELKASILSKGLLHPIVLRSDGKTLVAGRCRTAAITELYKEGKQFSYNGLLSLREMVPFTTIADLSLADIEEAELEENLTRADLPWTDAAEARVKIFELRKLQAERRGEPEPARFDIARELAEKTGSTPMAAEHDIRRSKLYVENKSNPRVSAAKSLKEAERIVLDDISAKLQAKLYTSGIVKVEHKLFKGDCRELMLKLEKGTFDLILSDPPYGIGADEMKNTYSHVYDDSPEAALELNKFIIREGFQLLKPKGLIILFTDIEHFKDLRTYAAQQAFTPWRTPIIWYKGDSGFAPWARGGFMRTYEMAMLLTKGQRHLKRTTPDVKRHARPNRDKEHKAEKPVELFADFISLCCDPGDLVLDPCCGSGVIFEAATAAKVTAIGIELDTEYHALAAARLARTPDKKLKELEAEKAALS